MSTVLIVEDDLDIRAVIEAIFAMDSRFTVAGLADSAEEAVDLARRQAPDIIVLDDRLNGALRGIDAVARFKRVAPKAKIILYTAHADLQARVNREPAVDAFLLKTDPGELLPMAQRLANMLSLV